MKTLILAAKIIGCAAILSICGCVHFVNKSEARHTIAISPDGTVTETWEDTSRGSGSALLADPKVVGVNSAHTNQTALGGGRTFTMGQFESVVSSNGISATGTAGGNIIGQAIGAASGNPVPAIKGLLKK